VGNSATVKHILGRHGGWKKSVAPVKQMLRTVLDGLIAGKTNAQIESDLLKRSGQSVDTEVLGFAIEERRSAWRETKSASRRRASIESSYRCAICKARLDPNTASDDHVQRRDDGGKDAPDNAQLTHHFCNHGFKEYFAQQKLPVPEIEMPLVDGIGVGK
jgi:hypothetical protein